MAISMSIWQPDGPRVKTVLQSACTRPDATVPPSRRQRGKKSEGWVVAVLKDPASFPEASCVVGVLQGWELSADDELRSPDHTTKGLAVLGCAAPIPHCDATSQDAVYSTSVKVSEDD